LSVYANEFLLQWKLASIRLRQAVRVSTAGHDLFRRPYTVRTAEISVSVTPERPALCRTYIRTYLLVEIISCCI